MKIHITLLALAALSFSARARDFTGVWKAEFETQLGLQKYTFALKQDGIQVTGKAHAEIGDQKSVSEVTEGKVDGDTLSFVELLNFQGSDLRIRYTGKLSGSEIKFTRAVGEVAKEQLTARREGPAASAPAVAVRPRARGGFGGPIALGPDDQSAFPPVPEDFDRGRDGIVHGKLEMVEYDFQHWKKALYHFSQRIFKPTGK